MPRDLSNPRKKFDPVRSTSWCFIHAHWEPVYENNYRVCANCGHAYWTERALIIKQHDEALNFYHTYGNPDEPAPKKVDDAATIVTCPLCGDPWG